MRPSSSEYLDLSTQALQDDAVSAVRLFAGAFGLAVPEGHLEQVVSVVAVPTVWVHSPALHFLCGMHTSSSLSLDFPLGAEIRKKPLLQGVHFVSVLASPSASVHSPASHVW